LPAGRCFHPAPRQRLAEFAVKRAIADYGADEIRLMRRCQVMATKVFDPEFLRPVRALSSVEA